LLARALGSSDALSTASLGLANTPLSGLTDLAAIGGSLRSSGSMVASPLLTVVPFLLGGSIMNSDPLHYVGAISPPPSSRSLGTPSYKDIVHSSSNSLMVQESLAISIPLVKDVSKEAIYTSTALTFQIIGLWPRLIDLHKWISNLWQLMIKGEAFIFPCAKGLFIVMFDNAHDRDLILKIGPWFWVKSSLCMKPRTPSFDPVTDSLSTTPVWVRLPNLPLHLWGLLSLRAIRNALGKFHYRNEETENYTTTTYAQI